MAEKVLIVDDEIEILEVIKRVFEQYNDVFSVLLAHDGEEAVRIIEENDIALVVTDLIMPRMDGFSLLIHIMSDYPHIPVIIMTAHSKPVMERMARKIGVAEYVEKPFDMSELAQRILTILKETTDGTRSYRITPAKLLQLIENEQKTCTIMIQDNGSGMAGELFFLDGELMNARTDGIVGEAAVKRILTWEDVTLSIQNVCEEKDKRIHEDLQSLLLEAIRLKEEKTR